MHRAAALASTLVAVAAIAAACGGGAERAAPTPRASVSPAAMATATHESVTLDGEAFVAVRTLAPSALSAEKLEAAGAATDEAGARIDMARADTKDVARWELVSASPDGWRVWWPRAVFDTLAAAGGGASIVSVTPMEWPDACMGLAKPGEVCAQVVTPGYAVVVERAGQRTEYHTSRAPGARRTAL